MHVIVALGWVVFLVLPLAAWALVSRTRLIGWTIAATLMGCDVGWLLLVTGHIGPASIANLSVALTVITPVLMLGGLLAERKIAGVPGHSSRGRRIAGSVLFPIGVAANVIVMAGLLFVLSFAPDDWNYTPPSSDVLPLPAGLTVVSDQDLGCEGSGDFCTREVDITSITGLSPRQTARLLVAGLVRMHGWDITAGTPSACRTEGMGFGTEQVCIEVQPTTPVKVLLGNDLGG